MRPLITNIQRMCVHDGPGIRTTVFFKGCSLRCPWCANPENLKPWKEYYFIREKCGRCCDWKETCPAPKGEKIREIDAGRCCYGAIGCFGRRYSCEELYEELLRDKAFYGTEGGVTFSGGEALLYLPQYEKTLELLHRQGINICLETALHVPTDRVVWAADRIDYFYVDVKAVEGIVLEKVLGGNTKLFAENLEKLFERVPGDRIIFRIPLVPGVTETEENLAGIERVLIRYSAKRTEIFSVHNLGEKKYERLGIPCGHFERVRPERLQEIMERFQKNGIETSINAL